MTYATTERLPWCDTCEAFSVPREGGTCGDCGSTVVFREGER